MKFKPGDITLRKRGNNWWINQILSENSYEYRLKQLKSHNSKYDNEIFTIYGEDNDQESELITGEQAMEYL